MPSRREFVKAGGVALAGLVVAPLSVTRGRVGTGPVVIEMRSDTLGARVWFDPVGLYLNPGATVRWVVRENVHTTTAYHPGNDSHSLRIPESAAAWDSGYLVYSGEHFDLTLTVPGVYDYYCAPHEAAGMVGRIVVGNPSGPGAAAFDYWVGRAGTDGWRRVPDAARSAFPSVEQILRERRVRPAGPGG